MDRAIRHEDYMKKQFRLPGGNYTTSTRRYMREWKKLTRAVERKLDARVYAFDPDVAVCLPDWRSSATLPLWVAQRIAGLEPNAEVTGGPLAARPVD